MTSDKATTRRYPPELKERAVKMVQELRAQDPRDKTVISRVARQLGIGDESLRSWAKQAEVDAGNRPGLTTEEQAELKRLRKENFELRRANDILQSGITEFVGIFGGPSRHRPWSECFGLSESLKSVG